MKCAPELLEEEEDELLVELPDDELDELAEDDPPHIPLLQPPDPVGVDQLQGWSCGGVLRVHWLFQTRSGWQGGLVTQPQMPPPELLLMQPHVLVLVVL